MTIKFGVTLPQFTAERDRFLDGARRAEQLGYDSVWVFDHLWPLTGGRERPVLESWTSLAYLAAATERVSIGSLVTRSSLRHPVVLAKMLATVGEVAPGRVVCGLGSGDELSHAENSAFGIAFFGGDDRVNQLASTLEVLTSYTSEGVVSHTDGFARVRDIATSPRPDPAPEIWLAGESRSIGHLAGEGADGWNGWGGDLLAFERAARRVTEAAGGRAVEISWAGLVLMAGTDEEAATKLGERDPQEWIYGSPETVAAKLARFVDAGAAHLVAVFPDAGEMGSYELFARSVIPLLRDRKVPLGGIVSR